MALVGSLTPWVDGLQPVRAIESPFTDEPDPSNEPLGETAWVVAVDPARGKPGAKIIIVLALVDVDERRVFGGTATVTAYCFLPPASIGLKASRPEPAFVVATKTDVNLDEPLQLDVLPGSKVKLRLTSIVDGGASARLMISMADMQG